jgi:ABC-type glucose/galactose transport system permease subunit
MNKQFTGKVLISIAVALSAIVSTIVDLLPGDTGHVFNPSWNPHAVFHDIVMFLLLDWMALVCLWLLWRKSSEPLVGVKVATLLVLGFWTPFYYVSTVFPMASLSANLQEMDKVSFLVGGLRVYMNVMIGSAMVVIALIGYWLYGRGTPPSPALARR